MSNFKEVFSGTRTVQGVELTVGKCYTAIQQQYRAPSKEIHFKLSGFGVESKKVIELIIDFIREPGTSKIVKGVGISVDDTLSGLKPASCSKLQENNTPLENVFGGGGRKRKTRKARKNHRKTRRN